MADVKITDLVDQSTIDKIKELNTEMQNTLTTYTTVAKDLAKGIDIPVKGLDDLEKLQNLLAQKSKEAAASTEQLTRVVSEQREVIANTTNTISRQLMEQERVNKTQREAYTEHDKVKKLLDQYHDTYENQVQSLVSVNRKLDENKKAQKDNEKQLSMGRISMQQFTQKQAELVAQHRALTQEKRTLTQIMTAEEKAAQSQEGSYVHMSQQLELLKKAYKDLSDEGRNSDFGKELETTIQNLDAHLKDTAADMGEFQRNVGNYAIAGQNGVVATESLIAVLSQETSTMQDVADQTKILEEGKRLLNTEDANYQATLDAVNAKLEENKRKLTDVSDIIGVEAKSVSEAEAQNKRLSEAIKHIDLTSAGAKERIKEMRDQIERNNKTIGEATGANEKFADSILGLIGVNTQFGSSLKTLGSGGNFIDGLNTKTKAFAQTLMGLLANPWVLAFLGIAAVGMAVKWWYDYNKGLIEASRLTQNFTGLVGEAADKVTTDMQTMADKMGKGFEETIGAANTLVTQFGVSWDEATQLIQDGIVAGADMSGKFVENIERFGPALRDCGVEADELVAILSETRNGIFNEDGVQAIVKASTRLRAMTKQTEESLEAVGISAKQMQEDLESGNISMIEAVQQVSEKLKELPENSQEAGQVIKNVFGRTAAEGGQLLLQSIADVNTNLDEQKEKMGELGRINEEQMEAQKELNETLAAVFKMSGTSFEEMTTQAKTYITKGLTAIIKCCVDIANWFIRMYNKSMVFRGAINSIGNTFSTLWEIAKFVFNQLIDSLEAAGGIIEGIFTLDWDKVEASWEKGANAFSGNVETMIKNIASNTAAAWNRTLDDELEEFSVDLTPATDSTPATPHKKGGSGKGSGSDDDCKGGKSGSGSKEAEKAAKEQLKILEQLEEATIQAMQDGHDKEIELIKLKYKKKLDAIKGNSAEEQALRIQLIEQMETDIAAYELKYQQNLAKINLENRLATVKEGSREERDLKLAQLEAQRQAELKAAELTGADKALINEKYNQKVDEVVEKYEAAQAERIAARYASEESAREAAFTREANALREKYAEEMALAKGNAAKQEELKEQLEDDLFKLSTKYSEESAQAAVDMIQEILNLENLSAADRLKWEQELARAQIALSNQVTDNAVENAERQAAADDKLRDKRKENLDRWLNVASDVISNISGLVNAIFDGQIQKIEEEQEANTEAGEKEQERISELVEKKVITEEEGEARKRAAEAATAKKNEELEKKKAKLQRKQAIFQKATDVAQAGINTALAITNALTTSPFPLGIAMAAIAGAMGAVQIATILATPIPAYAKGTDYHKGGPAIVGDGGRSEVVVFNGSAWLTPDKPTLVDMPKGAAVIPSINQYDNNIGGMAIIPTMSERQIVMSGYDDKNMRRGVSELAYLIRQNTKQQRELAYRQEYELFKSRI